MDTSMVRRAGVRPLSTVEEGARAILNLATSPTVAGRTGLYFNGLQEARPHAQANDADARRRLQALSLELTGLSAKDMAAWHDSTVTRRFNEVRVGNCHDEYAPPWHLALTPPSWIEDQKFKSGFLQRGVRNETVRLPGNSPAEGGWGGDPMHATHGRGDIARVARGFGLNGSKVTSLRQFEALFREHQAQDGVSWSKRWIS
jgi:hypothetical protein